MTSKQFNLISRIKGDIQDLMDELESIQEAAQEKLDGRSDKYREGEKGEADEQDISYIEQAREGLQTALDELENFPLD